MSVELHTRLIVPARPERLRPIRQMVRTVGALAGVPGDRIDDMVVAVGEACANVVAHAYGEDGGDLHLAVERRDHDLVIVVSDSGAPIIERTHEGAGVGLHLIQHLSHSVAIEGPGDTGTVVTMTFKVAE